MAKQQTDPATESTGADNSDVVELSFEQARDELAAVVARLEAGGEPLEGALALWERGEALAARCQQVLDGTRERLDAAQLVAESDAAESGGPF